MEMEVGWPAFAPVTAKVRSAHRRDPDRSIFSPVKRVRYGVEDARVGQRTDYDRLVLECGPTVA